MRNIWYRAKKSPEYTVPGWVYGFPTEENGKWYIVDLDVDSYEDAHVNKTFKVIPETISKPTGKRDVAGQYIYENDIILVDMENGTEEKYIIIWDDDSLYFEATRVEGDYNYIDAKCWNRARVVGNKYD